MAARYLFIMPRRALTSPPRSSSCMTRLTLRRGPRPPRLAPEPAQPRSPRPHPNPEAEEHHRPGWVLDALTGPAKRNLRTPVSVDFHAEIRCGQGFRFVAGGTKRRLVFR